jgi:hypothetical protein
MHRHDAPLPQELNDMQSVCFQYMRTAKVVLVLHSFSRFTFSVTKWQNKKKNEILNNKLLIKEIIQIKAKA